MIHWAITVVVFVPLKSTEFSVLIDSRPFSCHKVANDGEFLFKMSWHISPSVI